MAPTTWTQPNKINLDINSLRSKVANGQISVADANSQIDAAAKAYATYTSPAGTEFDNSNYNSTLSQLKSQAFTGLGNIKQPDGQVYSVDSNGNATKVSTSVHQSTTNGAGTSSSTSAVTGNPKASDYKTTSAYQKALVSAGWSQSAASQQASQSQSQGLLTASSDPASTSTQNNPSSTPTGSTGFTQPESTGHAALDKTQTAQYDYVTGSLAAGYTINPALTGTNLASMLPQFIQETAAQLEPELQQNLQTEMVGINNSLNQLSTVYKNSQGQTIQDFQQSLGSLRDQTSMGGGAERALESGLVNSANRSLSSLDTTYATNVSGVLNAGGAALGQGASGAILSGTGSLPASLAGYSAGSLTAPNTPSLQVTNQGGDSPFAGSSTAGRDLNFNYTPSMYTYGSIPAAFGQSMTSGLNQLFGNYQQGSAATPSSSAPVASAQGRQLSYSGSNGHIDAQGNYVSATA